MLHHVAVLLRYVAAMPSPACSAASYSTAVGSFKKTVVLLYNAIA
jgi:hypothetical protein